MRIYIVCNVLKNKIYTNDYRYGFNKWCISKFREGSRVRQTPEEGQRTYQLKHCGNNNKDEDNCPKTLNDKNHQGSSQEFRQLEFTQYLEQRQRHDHTKMLQTLTEK